MRRKGSDIAKEIVASWKREKYNKEKAERNMQYWKEIKKIKEEQNANKES